jgi:hypothetical protein
MGEKALKALDDAIHWLERYRYFMTHQYEHQVLSIEGSIECWKLYEEAISKYKAMMS